MGIGFCIAAVAAAGTSAAESVAFAASTADRCTGAVEHAPSAEASKSEAKHRVIAFASARAIGECYHGQTGEKEAKSSRVDCGQKRFFHSRIAVKTSTGSSSGAPR